MSTNDIEHKKTTQPLNQNNIRMSVMTRLLAEHYTRTGVHIVGSSAIGCQRWKKYTSVNPDKAEIAITLTNGNADARMHDHFVCNNYKFCPTCARRGAAEMRDGIENILIPAAASQGYALAMLTLTASHKRDCDWKADIADPFFAALKLFSRRMGKAYKAIGCPGQLRAIESPVGKNGLHLHSHDELLYTPGADLIAFEAAARTKWAAACAAVGLHCNSHGVDFRLDFNPLYVAKDETRARKEAKGTAFELAAHDTKTESKSKTLFQLLDACAKGDKDAGQDYIRAVTALQGRSRWNIGGLAKKLGIPAPTEWRSAAQGKAAESKPVPALLVSYPIEEHLIATTPDSKRSSLALILRAARQEMRRPGSVNHMVKALSDEVVNARVAHIRHKYAKRIAKRLDNLWAETIHESIKHKQKATILAIEFKYMQAAIAEYEERNKLLNPVYAKKQRELWLPVNFNESESSPAPLDLAPIAPNLELDFS